MERFLKYLLYTFKNWATKVAAFLRLILRLPQKSSSEHSLIESAEDSISSTLTDRSLQKGEAPTSDKNLGSIQKTSREASDIIDDKKDIPDETKEDVPDLSKLTTPKIIELTQDMQVDVELGTSTEVDIYSRPLDAEDVSTVSDEADLLEIEDRRTTPEDLSDEQLLEPSTGHIESTINDNKIDEQKQEVAAEEPSKAPESTLESAQPLDEKYESEGFQEVEIGAGEEFTDEISLATH